MSDALLANALERAVRWIEVPATWAGHRAEPLAAERLWACTADGPSQAERRAGKARRAGLDARGDVVAVGPADVPPASWSAPPHWVEVVVRSPGTVTVHGFGRGVAPTVVTTSFDDSGRALRTTYGDGVPAEEYSYDSVGRLVGIAESPGLATLTTRLRQDELLDGWIGGALAVEHDDAGPVRVVRAADGAPVWERVDGPWGTVAASTVAPLVAAVADAVAGLGLAPDTAVHALVLETDPADWPAPGVTVVVATEAGRARALETLDDDPEALEEALWRGEDPDGDGDDVAYASLEGAAAQAALRTAATLCPGDPRATLLTAAVGLLAAVDWTPRFAPTPDFVVYLNGDDAGWTDLYASLVAANPPERVEERRRRWRGSPFPPEADAYADAGTEG
jgi:hypothetical protein